MAKRICRICGDEFESKTSRRSVCYKIHYHNCPICGKQVITKDLQHLNSCCSPECSRKQATSTTKERYEVWPSNSAEACQKRKETCIQKFGVDNPFKSEDIQKKIKEINLERYGTEYPTQCEFIQDRIRLACMEKWGVDWPTKSEEIKAKTKKTMLERYGYTTNLLHPTYVSSYLQHMMSTYGVSNPMQSQEILDIRVENSLQKYGTESPVSEGTSVRNKLNETFQKKYGGNSPFCSEDVRNKSKETLLKHYGVDCYFKSPEALDRTKASNLEKYGVEWPSQIRETHVKASINKSKIQASDGTHFDSSYEVDVYEFCLRNNLNLERQIPITYIYQGKEHTTFIDFKIEGVLFECKGAHLLAGVYDSNPDIVPIEVKLDVYKRNNVIVITDSTAKSVFGKPNSTESNGLKYRNKCPDPLIGVDLDLFGTHPNFPFRSDRPELFYKVKVDGQKSSYDAFYDEHIRWKMILNRIEYSGGFIDNNQMLTALNVTRTCKQPSWFSKSFAKRVLKRYATQSVVVDPFAGWGTRCDAAAELNFEYVGGDYNKEQVAWHNQNGRSNIQFKDARDFKYTEPCTVFICPPYSDPKTGRCFEDYNFEGFDESAKTLSQCDWLKIVMENIPNAKEYIMVCKIVDEGFEDYIVDTKSNKSHFGTNNEYILVVKN